MVDLITGDNAQGNLNGDYLAYSQFQQSDIPNYFSYASNFVLADNMFSSLTGPSFPNHLYTVAAQSQERSATRRLAWGLHGDAIRVEFYRAGFKQRRRKSPANILASM